MEVDNEPVSGGEVSSIIEESGEINNLQLPLNEVNFSSQAYESCKSEELNEVCETGMFTVQSQSSVAQSEFISKLCENENTAQSINSETTEAVRALEECYSDLNDTLNANVDLDGKETHNVDTTYDALSSDCLLEVSGSNVISNNSEETDSSHAIQTITSVKNSTISPSQVMDFDENAQYKVAEVAQSEDSTLQPEFEGITFSSDVPIYHTENNEDSLKSEEINVNNVFSNTIVSHENTNIDSNDSLIKFNDERSVSSSVPPVYEDRSEISDNSPMTFPDKITANDSVNGDVSSDAEFSHKANMIESTLKSEDSSDVMITCASTPEPNVDSCSNLEPVDNLELGTDRTEPEPSTSGGFTLPPENLFEYQWPQESGAEWYMLQEQISEFLYVKSFKRKYPELTRRIPAQEEKEFLKMRAVVTESQSDLGLTALRADEVHDLMMRDYPRKYQEYAKVLHEKEKQNLKEKLKSYSAPKMDKVKFALYLKKAVKSAAEFNTQFQRERREERRAYLDLQTMAVHYPSSKRKVLPPEMTKPSAYPVSLMPGQFQDYYKTYSPDELKYLPLNTAIYGPPKTFSLQQTLDMSAKIVQDEDSANSNDEETPTLATGDGDAINATVKVKDTPLKPVDKVKSEDARCRVCEPKDEADSHKKVVNKERSSEELVQCSECNAHGHPSCLDLTPQMVIIIKTYPWQCMDCKTCVECTDPYDEDKMMFCDRCDRGYHTFCVGLRGLPTGRWECRSCCMEPPRRKKLKKDRRDKKKDVLKPEPESVQ